MSNENKDEVQEEIFFDDEKVEQKVEEKVEEVKEPTELEKMTTLCEDYKRKWYAVSAEYDNFRKRNASAVSIAFSEGKVEALKKLLPIVDSFGFALDTCDEKTKLGIEKIIKNFNSILDGLGIAEIEMKVGDNFCENTAEAIFSVPAEENEKPQTIKQIVKKGYKMGDKVIRFAQVVVTV